ncbi:hypothetical protein K1719_004342 [Acacia pycnantha]|nr:hypothetical protein K1719_004342 [Acacia pycnantha]
MIGEYKMLQVYSASPPIVPSHPQIPEILKTNLLRNFNSPFELKQVHALLIKTHTPLSSLPLTRVGLVCALNPSFAYAQRIFQTLEKPEIVVWNSCLKIFAEGDSPQDAIFLFYRLRQVDVLPDDFTFSFVLKACANLLDVFNCRIVHGYVEKLGLQSNLILQNMIVHLYALCGAMSDARLLFVKMPQRDVVTYNIMISQWIKAGNLNMAYGLFSKMSERNVRSWTSMISGFVQFGRSKDAIRLFLEMESEGQRPNEVTLVAVLSACADLGALDLGKRVHEYSNQSGFHENLHISNTLIDMYVKCGCLEDSYRVFEAMRERTIVSWSAMIAGFAMHGEGEKALELYDEMIRSGMKPNDVTFVALLHACSHLGLVDKGREFFTMMTRDYGIEPKIEHFGCMVDLFSRAGLMKDAHEFIVNMPMAPNGVIWGALLGGCRVHKNIELAEEAIRHISELDPLNDGYHVVLSNVYAEAGQWEKVARIRKLMKHKGVKKTPGWSSITINGAVHEFVAGDESHPQAEEIFEMWEKLLVKMKLKGYVPNTSVVLLDVEDKEKEKFLFRHSEKLALVFGLMKLPPGMSIRIMKNLRMCEDCHATFKLISAIENRDIVVRDRNRFHCFKNGACTCRDYW